VCSFAFRTVLLHWAPEALHTSLSGRSNEIMDCQRDRRCSHDLLEGCCVIITVVVIPRCRNWTLWLGNGEFVSFNCTDKVYF
jgi:hypothetical protein